MDPVLAARTFLGERFPESLCAFLAGSVLRGDATPTSDLDIVIITTREDAPFRAAYREHGWPIEVFVHTTESYRWYFTTDGNRPVLPTMVAEGIVLRDTDGLAQRIQAESRDLIERGTPPLTPEEVIDRRYALTDTLDDFTGSDRQEESLLLAATLAEQAANLVLLHHRRWIGHGKWVTRALRRFDPALADRLAAALVAHGRAGEKDGLIRFAEDALNLVGGRYFEGDYRQGMREPTMVSNPRHP